jgi:hypothetical protein
MMGADVEAVFSGSWLAPHATAARATPITTWRIRKAPL